MAVTAVRRQGRWEAAALRAMEYVAYPALAGAALLLLGIGVVTWLPALAAAAHALHRWRTDQHTRCFTTVFAVFGGYWRHLWRTSLAATAAVAVLLANTMFLSTRPEPVALALLGLQAGLAAALALYSLAVAVTAARDPGTPQRWRRDAAVLAFGSPRRSLALLAALITTPLLTLPLTVGPLLLGPTLPLLLGLALAERNQHGSTEPRS